MKNLRFNTYYYNTLNDLYYIVRSKSPETVLLCLWGRVRRRYCRAVMGNRCEK